MLIRLVIALATAIAIPHAVVAHSLGPRYELPLPLWLFLTGAGLAVGLSFLVILIVVKRGGEVDRQWSTPLQATWLGRTITHRTLKSAMQFASVTLFFLVIATGLFGVPDMLTNFSTVFVWIVWWTGMAFVQVFVGDLWAVVNPWAILYDACANLARRLGWQRRTTPRYPVALSYWPAAGLFLIWSWLENVSMTATEPAFLATLVLAYSALTWIGMIAFGRDPWLKHAELFNVVFGLFARFGRIHRMPGKAGRQWAIRPYAVGLLTTKPVSGALLVLVVMVLATVSFDGFEETRTWVELSEDIQTSQWLKPYRADLIRHGINLRATIKTVAMLASTVIFLLAFIAVARAADLCAGAPRRGGMYYFVLTLVPIALGYHVAHYLSYFVIAGQILIPVASDPFGIGWNLFGTTTYQINTSIVTARDVWYSAVTAVIVGHIAAVYLSHVMALRLYQDRRAALLSQVPMLLLMVGYTVFSLWILAQPIVKG